MTTVEELKSQLFPPGADIISGFGGGYEDTCQNMVAAGVKWCIDNPDKAKALSVKEYTNIYGICDVEGAYAKEFDGVLMEACHNDCTGAMHQASVNHIFWVFSHSIEEYRAEVEKRVNSRGTTKTT